MLVHFRRIYRSGLEHVPASGPLIFACNHPNAFLDAIVVALSVKRPVHFLTRSDVFKTRLARFFLERLNMIPIYRMRDGMDSLDKNKAVFQRCIDILQEGKILLIFSEGNCIMEKRLRSLKKGTARIAFLAEDACNWQMNLKIIPVGINYIKPQSYRTDLIITFGNSFQVNDLNELVQRDLPKAIHEFNRRLETKLKDLVWIIPDFRNEREAEFQLQTLSGSFNYSLFQQITEAKLILQKGQLLLLEPDAEGEIHALFKMAHKANLSTRFSKDEVSVFLILLGILPAFVSSIFLILPWSLAYFITTYKVRVKKFRSSILFGSMFILSLVIGLIYFFVILAFMHPLFALLFIVFYPIGAWFLPLWLNACEAWYFSRKYSLLERKHKVSFKHLIIR